MQPHRRCHYMNERGEQCETWFEATDDNKLCLAHREVALASSNGAQKIRYIDLANDQREYLYHFKDGAAQQQSKTLVYEFKDDQSGSCLDKIANHIAFLDKVLEDVKSRMAQTRAVRGEKLDSLTEAERKELRKIKTSDLTPLPKQSQSALKVEKTASAWKDRLKLIGASIDLDPEEMLKKFAEAKAKKEPAKKEPAKKEQSNEQTI